MTSSWFFLSALKILCIKLVNYWDYTEMHGQQNDKYTEMHGQRNIKKICEVTISPTFHEKRGFRSDLGHIITWESDCQHGCQSTLVQSVKSVTCIFGVFSTNHDWDN